MLSHLNSQNLLLEVLLEVMIFDLVRTYHIPCAKSSFAHNLPDACICRRLAYLTILELTPCIARVTRNSCAHDQPSARLAFGSSAPTSVVERVQLHCLASLGIVWAAFSCCVFAAVDGLAQAPFCAQARTCGNRKLSPRPGE